MAIMAAMVLTLTGLSGCNQNNALTAYNNSVDVPLMGWTSADTLFYHITVTDPATIKTPIAISRDYQLNIGFRYSSAYPLSCVAYHLLLQKTDTTGGYEHPTVNLLRQDMTTMVRDSIGTPLGDTWGSLISLETRQPDLTIRFDSAGTYRFLLIPDLGELSALPGVASASIRLDLKDN